jgi:hypothetical protein
LAAMLLKNADSLVESTNEVVKFIANLKGTLQTSTSPKDCIGVRQLNEALIESFLEIWS